VVCEDPARLPNSDNCVRACQSQARVPTGLKLIGRNRVRRFGIERSDEPKTVARAHQRQHPAKLICAHVHQPNGSGLFPPRLQFGSVLCS